MDLQKPIIDQIQNSVPDTTEIRNSIGNSAQNAFTSLADTATNVRSSLDEFGKNVGTGADTLVAPGNFLDLNGIFAKIAFLIFVLFGFMFLTRIGISLIGYFTLPSQNPYVIKGMLSGSSAVDISQDPSDPKSVPITRSNDANKGAEFTWSVWLFANQPAPSSPGIVAYKPIFVKGEGEFDPATGINVCNGPGMYLTTDSTTGVSTVRICMDTINKHDPNATASPDVIDIPNIPQQKWVHIAIRLQNTLLDTYVNGVIATRTTLSAAPKQNYYDVHVCPNGGFSGSISDLRYFNHAQSVFGINSIVMYGPNTKTSATTTDAKAVGGNYSYLSNKWYG